MNDSTPPKTATKVATPATAGDEPAPTAPRGGKRKRVILGAVAVIALAALGDYGYQYWLVGRFMVTTTDAYLKADITAIAPRVQGYVERVSVHENQRVKAGQLLVALDDGDFRNALQSAEAAVAVQQKTIAQIAARIVAAQDVVPEAEAARYAAAGNLRNAQAHFERIQHLAHSSVAAQAQLDAATADLDQAQAALAGAKAKIAAARANVEVLKAQRAQAESQLTQLKLAVDQAKRNLGRTRLVAPIDGIVTNISARIGDLLSPGQRVAGIVPVDHIYVEANYKETQIANIVPGAPATIRIDAIPGKVFHGTVTSLAPATEAQFALLPPQNATGNFTKVVQRVPVRIRLPQSLRDSGRLSAGLSVEAAVDSRAAPRNR